MADRNRAAEDRQETAAVGQELILLQDSIRARKGLLACGDEYAAAVTGDGHIRFAGSNTCGQEAAAEWQEMTAVFGGRDYLLGLTRTGLVRFAGRSVAGIKHAVAHWTQVVLMDCAPTHVAALLAGGRVRCAGENAGGCTDTEEWRDIRDICCGKGFTLGLTAQGEVLIAGGSFGLRERIATWGRVAGLFSDAQGTHAYAITADGHLVSTRPLSRQVRGWDHLIFAAADSKVWAVTASGTLYTTGTARAQRRAAADSRQSRDAIAALAVGGGQLLTLERTGSVRAWPVERREHRLDIGWSDFESWRPLFRRIEELDTARRRATDELRLLGRSYLLRETQAIRYRRHLACGSRMTACITADGGVLTTGTPPTDPPGEWRDVLALSCGESHLLALRRDGRVLACGNDTGGCCATTAWERVVAILACPEHSLGLREDGRVLYAGAPNHPAAEAATWTGIRLLRGNHRLTVGVTFKGQVVACGSHPALAGTPMQALADWQDIQDVVVSEHLVAGLRRDGTVVALGDAGLSRISDAVAHWRDIRALAAGGAHLVGLCIGGDVVAAGQDMRGQCRVSDWHRVVAIACGEAFTLGLGADGRVLAVGQLYTGTATSRDGWIDLPADGWDHVLALACGRHHAVALTERGQLLTCGLDTDGQCRGAVGFTLFADQRQFDGVSVFEKDTRRISEKTLERRRADEGTAFAEACGWFSYAALLWEDARRLAARMEVSERGLTLHTEQETLYWDQRSRCIGKAGRDPVAADEARVHLTLTEAGGLLATGENSEGQCETSGWSGLIAASTSGDHTVGLRRNGHVLAVGRDQAGECRVESWRRIIQVLAIPGRTLGLCADGHIRYTGSPQKAFDELCGVRAIAGTDGRHDRVAFLLYDGSIRLYVRRSEYEPEPTGLYLFHPGPGDSLLTRFAPRMDTPEGARQARRLLGCGTAHAVRLLPRGRVCALGANDQGQCEVTGWRDVTAVACGASHTVAVADGRICAVGKDHAGQCDTDTLNQALVDGEGEASRYRTVAAGYAHTVALRADGRAFAVGASEHGQCQVAAWRDLLDVACGVRHTVALTADGRCLATGDNTYGQCAVEAWRDIVMVACGERHTVGLTVDGRVLVAGDPAEPYCQVEDIQNVISVACLPDATVCIHADGRMTVRGDPRLAAAVAPIRDAVAADGREYRLAVLTLDRRVLLLPERANEAVE